MFEVRHARFIEAKDPRGVQLIEELSFRQYCTCQLFLERRNGICVHFTKLAGAPFSRVSPLFRVLPVLRWNGNQPL